MVQFICGRRNTCIASQLKKLQRRQVEGEGVWPDKAGVENVEGVVQTRGFLDEPQQRILRGQSAIFRLLLFSCRIKIFYSLKILLSPSPAQELYEDPASVLLFSLWAVEYARE